MRCYKCGKDLPPDSKFCQYCGEDLSHVKYCLFCGIQLQEEMNFCPQCGKDIRKTTSDQPIESNGVIPAQDEEAIPVWVETAAIVPETAPIEGSEKQEEPIAFCEGQLDCPVDARNSILEEKVENSEEHITEHEIEYAIASKMYQSALALALTLPDICGKAETPSAQVRVRYRAWFDKHVAPLYMPKCILGMDEPDRRIMTGDICYALRCSYLHSGNDDIGNKGREAIKSDYDEDYTIAYKLILTIDEDANDGVECNTDNSTREREYIVHINIPKMCCKICEAAKAYVSSHGDLSAFDENTISVYSSKKWDSGWSSFFIENQ